MLGWGELVRGDLVGMSGAGGGVARTGVTGQDVDAVAV
jgi:hypothetical protein